MWSWAALILTLHFLLYGSCTGPNGGTDGGTASVLWKFRCDMPPSTQGSCLSAVQAEYGMAEWGIFVLGGAADMRVSAQLGRGRAPDGLWK